MAGRLWLCCGDEGEDGADGGAVGGTGMGAYGGTGREAYGDMGRAAEGGTSRAAYGGTGGTAEGGTSREASPLPPAERWRPGTELSRYDAVLLWGGARWGGWTAPDGGSPWVLNAGAADAAAMGPERMARRLGHAGIRAGREDAEQRQDGTSGRADEAFGSSGRLYWIGVFHLETLWTARVRPGIGRASLPAALAPDDAASGVAATGAQDPELRRAGRLVWRAAYELGLDAAELLVRVADDGRMRLEGLRLAGSRIFRAVGPGGLPPEAERLPPPAAERWADAAARLAAVVRAEAQRAGGQADRPLRLGADPEFLLLRADGRVVSASRLGGLHSPVGSDVLVAGQSLRQPVGELRPEPAEDPEELLRRIRRLLALASRRGAAEPGMRLAAGGMPVPGIALGGHVHLSGLELTTRLLRALDSYAALPLALAEDPAGRGRRPRYGTLGDSRRQPHGGFEYRTLPSWLVSPAAARYALAVCLLAAEDAAWLAELPAAEPEYAQAYYAGDRERMADCLPRLRASLRTAPSYEKHASLLEPFLEAVEAGKSWDEKADLRLRWGIPRAEDGPAVRPSKGSEERAGGRQVDQARADGRHPASGASARAEAASGAAGAQTNLFERG
ncbi:hypothetical protein B8V81_4229 [Paenibacillus pasadenensis]|uniref:Uncharacterized protein n=1 Tax=Paenibacillus pasadenensis TaxID=217090 RepID=A0A2N5N634_9BACL|nr:MULTISPECIES: hypothetical protein [Paenibacillus]PLT45798.1 hypothetical protein B8V81_4229 [Paenibacillus pasadenensis]QGG56234.1 hypothetical protein GE073_12015 [Paenibacillus sp. B01]